MESKQREQRPEFSIEIMGRNLRTMRKKRGYSAEEVRNYLMLSSVQSIYRYERGISMPPIDTFFALMELYDALPESIIAGAKKSKK